MDLVRIEYFEPQVDWIYRIPIGHHDVLGLMVQQTRDHLPEFDVSDGRVIRFIFNFGKSGHTLPDIEMRGRMKCVSIRSEKFDFPFLYDGKIRVIERSLLDEGSEFDFEPYNNEDAVGTENQIEKPAILESFPKRIREQLIFLHVVKDGVQAIDAVRHPVSRIDIEIQVPESVTFLFDV